MKLCTKCGTFKHETDFFKNKGNKSGLRSHCKDCVRIYYEQNKKRNKPEIKTKVCTKCGIEKNVSEFYKEMGRSDGYYPSCKKCESRYLKEYREINHERICTYKNQKSRESHRYYNGVLNIDSTTAYGVITEYTVSSVLSDCTNESKEEFHSRYDLYSKKYGIINVKSSKKCIKKRELKKSSSGVYSVDCVWSFSKRVKSLIPDYYICLGFDENRKIIEKVWIIPGNSSVVLKTGIIIHESIRGLQRVNEYEVDPTPYNEAYQNLDIYSLDEFRNLNNESSVTA